MVESMERMTRGRLCVLSRSAGGRRFYHLQYRRNTRLFQKYVPLAEVAAYEKATGQFRKFMAAVDAYVDEMSERGMKEIRDEAVKAKGRKTGTKRKVAAATDTPRADAMTRPRSQ